MSKRLRHCTNFFLIIVIITGWLYSGFPQIGFPITPTATPEGVIASFFGIPPKAKNAEAATVAIRQEINIIDAIVTASGDDAAIVQLDTTKYSGATYYFETVAQVDSGTLTVALERVDTATQDATIPVTATAYFRQRTEFTPPASTQTEYNINLANGTNPKVKAARIIILQSADPIEIIQTQIEIGNREAGKTNTATAALTSPKYWLYDSSLWDGSPSFYAEVTYRDYQVSSSTTYTTATTTTSSETYTASRGVSYVKIEAWGGGAGGGCSGNGGGGGGGGGYAQSLFVISEGTQATLSIGAGGAKDTVGGGANSTYDGTVVVADGGNGTTGTGAGTGGTSNTGNVLTANGGGGGAIAASPDTGGGGGGAGGPNGDGAIGQAGQAAAGGQGGQGNNGQGGAGGAGGVSGTAAKPGIAHATGGGGGGGSFTSIAVGGDGGAPGGGGGGADNNSCTGASGAPGQIILTETHGMANIALEEDDGAFGTWTNVAQIVTNGTATSSPDRVRVSFAPQNGRNYRLVASTTASTASYDIYNAKIIVDQATSPTKLEAQYLLLNTADSGSTGLQAYQTLYDAGEWTGSTVTYKVSHDATNASDASKLVDITADPDADLTNGSVTGANQQIGGSGITDLVDDRLIDVNVTNTTGAVTASRILAQASIVAANSPPTVDSVKLDRTLVTLSENSFIWASSTILVTDTNGCSDISGVSAKLYLASTTNSGTTCTYDGNNCYVPTGGCVATTTGNQCAADNDVEYDCGFQIWYTAEATDSSAPVWLSSIWSLSATATDAALETGTATNTTQAIEIGTLNALSLSGNVTYPETNPGANTGTNNQTVAVTNTGNTAIDAEISGDIMCTDYSACTGDSFGEDQQKFGTSDVTYSSLTNTLAATSSPATIELDLAKPTSTTTPVTVNLFWGIAIPSGRPPGSYTGQNTFSAVAD